MGEGVEEFKYASRTALAEPEYSLRPIVLSWYAISPRPTPPLSKMLRRQCCPSYAQRDQPQLRGPEVFYPAPSFWKTAIANP